MWLKFLRAWYLLSRQQQASLSLAGLLLLSVVLLVGQRMISNRSITLPVTPATFVADDQCKQCHVQEWTAWQSSHHALSMQDATPQTVLGDFNQTTFQDSGIEARFFKQGDSFYIQTAGENGEAMEFLVKYTFGVAPLQQYLLAFPKGRLQAFTVAWDSENHRWFNLYPDEKITADDPLHWTKRHFTWNSACAACHSTDLKLGYDPAQDSYQTTWAAINVGCQSCHGAGSQHIAWAKYPQPDASANSLLVDYKTMAAHTAVDSCAPCHARRYPISQDAQGQQPLLDHFIPELLNEELYYPDGQILDEVFEYGSFLHSKMYEQGVRCTDCHEPHSVTVRRTGNNLCTTCHQSAPPTTRFPTLAAKVYDSPTHHFHPKDSTGAQCVNCHMPSKTYMMIDRRRDHSLRIPRPDLSQKFGVPNACNQCHRDQSAAWASTMMTQWYGNTWQSRPQFAEAIAAGRAHDPKAVSALQTLAQDNRRPAIVRATAIHLLADYGDAGMSNLFGMLTDAEPLVRATTAEAFTQVMNGQRRQWIMPLVSDPIRAVRIASARAIAATPLDSWDAVPKQQLLVALDEYKAAQLAVADQPEGYANLGELYTIQGDLTQAAESYQNALKHDHHFWPAANRLAILYAQTQQPQEAEKVLRQAITVTPNQGELYYSLGLVLVELQRPWEALSQFAQAVALLPDQARLYYNYGLLLQQQRQFAQAENAFRRAIALSPTDREILYAIGLFYLQQQQLDSARPYIEELLQRYPDWSQSQQLLNGMRRAK